MRMRANFKSKVNNISCIYETLLQGYQEIPFIGRKIALIDLPSHLNIGDSLIALGQLSLLPQAADFLYVGGGVPLRILREMNAVEGIILLHGGGNFGSLWPKHQRLRELIAKECPKASVFQLPQSVFFSDKKSLNVSVGMLNKHNDFHVMVRDNVSFSILQEAGCRSVKLVPDSAFALENMQTKKAENLCDVLLLHRGDVEKQYESLFQKLIEKFPGKKVVVGDWASTEDLPFPLTTREKFLFWSAHKLIRLAPTGKTQLAAWKLLFVTRYRLGVRLVSCAKLVITDRLHVHILCSILGQPHVFLDNNYKKITNLASTWNTYSDIAFGANNLESVLDAINIMHGTGII